MILFHHSTDNVNVKPTPETTGRFTSMSQQPYRIRKPVQKIPLVIKREEKKKSSWRAESLETLRCKIKTCILQAVRIPLDVVCMV